MQIAVSATGRFVRTPDGQLWSQLAPYGHGFWTRYLEIFDQVLLMARAEEVEEPPAGAVQATGEGVEPVALPYYRGPEMYLRKFFQIRQAAAEAGRLPGAKCFRLPCPLGSALIAALPPDKPYGIEVVADPYDSLRPGSIQHPLRPFFRWLLPRRLRKECAGACAAAYVTQQALQKRYPPSSDAFTIHYSSLDLLDNSVVAAPRQFRHPLKEPTIVHVGAFTQLNKGQDTLLRAVAQLTHERLRPQLRFIGAGTYLKEMQSLANELGIADRSTFLGQMPSGEPVLKELRAADMFVLPSRQEGLPRAVIEAMASGLPVIASDVGGTGELLEDVGLVPPNDPEILAKRIEKFCQSTDLLNEQARLNLTHAHDYTATCLRPRRKEFYQNLKRLTEAAENRGAKP